MNIKLESYEQDSWRNVGQHIRSVRKANGLTLKQLAAGCGLSPNAISLVERGEVAPTIVTLCKIAHALGTPAGSFFQEVCTGEGGCGQTPKCEPFSPALEPARQTVLCLSGHLDYEVDGQIYPLSAGVSITVAEDAYQCLKNHGTETGMVILIAPPKPARVHQEGA